MRKLLVRLIIFWLPIAIPSLTIYGTGYYIGETMPLETVVSLQQNSDSLIAFQPTWQQADYIHYKLLGARASNPDILVFGSSRMLYYTDDFVANGVLYNASVAGTAIDYQLAMLNSLIETGTIPDVILLGIDIVNYNAAIPSFEASRTDIVTRNTDTDYLVAGFRDVFAWWFSGEMPDLMLQSRAEDGNLFLGREAIIDQFGLLRDGSTYVPNPSLTRIAENFVRTQAEYENATTHWTRGTEVNQTTLAILDNLLALAQENDISVIGLTQPFHPYFAERMQDNPEFAYRQPATDAITALFAEYGFPIYFFPDAESYGGSADDFLDDWHYNQLASLRIFNIIATQSPDLLGTYIDLAQLTNDIATTENPYAVYYPAPER